MLWAPHMKFHSLPLYWRDLKQPKSLKTWQIKPYLFACLNATKLLKKFGGLRTNTITRTAHIHFATEGFHNKGHKKNLIKLLSMPNVILRAQARTRYQMLLFILKKAPGRNQLIVSVFLAENGGWRGGESHKRWGKEVLLQAISLK